MKNILRTIAPGFLFAAVLGFLSALAATSSAQTTYPAENATLAGGAILETKNTGFNGTAYINFPSTGGTATFGNLAGQGGGAKDLRIRYANGGATARTGNLTVNGATQPIAFASTGSWTSWTTLTTPVTLTNNSTNAIQFASTGQDLANIDEITVATPSGANPIARWQPRDFSFVSATPPSNPFMATFSAVATGPGGVTLTIPGFYDGANTWKIRFSPTVVGSWNLKTASNVADLNGKTAALTCIANVPSNHGAIKVDASHPHTFVFEDGTRWFPMGYEADWLWALDLANATSLAKTAPFLDKIAASGFNFVLLQAYAQDTAWRAGATAADDYGPPAMYAWAGTNTAPDHSRMNVTYWQRYDRVIDALFQRGMVAHLMIKVYNKSVTWPANGSANDDLFFRYLIARYAAYPNITWDLAKEANNEPSTSYKTGRLNFIRDTDPYNRLLTVHTDDSPYNAGTYNSLVDYRSAQEEKTWHAPMKTYLGQRQWPVINVEFGYECGPGGLTDHTYSHVSLPKEVARRAWEVCTTGAFCAYYYTYTGWDVVRPTDTPPGYAYMKNLRAFFEETEYWLMTSSDNLVTNGGYCLARAGREYIVFHNAATTFQLTIAGASGALSIEWYEPYAGTWVSAGTVTNGTRTFTPPASLGTGPLALHVFTP